MKSLITGLCTVLLAVSEAGLASSVNDQQNALLGLRVSGKGLSYYVYSGGCTRKSDFKLNILESYPPQLQLVRLRLDHCKGLVPDGEEIFFGWNEIGLQPGMPFKVINPLKDFVVPAS